MSIVIQCGNYARRKTNQGTCDVAPFVEINVIKGSSTIYLPYTESVLFPSCYEVKKLSELTEEQKKSIHEYDLEDIVEFEK